MQPALPVNPVLTGLTEYFTDTTARARLRDPDGPWTDLSIGDPFEPTPEFIRRALVDAVTPVQRYPTTPGQPALREAVAGWMRRRHGVDVDPDIHVLPSSGSKEAIFHLPLALIDAGGARRHVLWGEPGYPVYERGAQFAGGVSDPVALRPETGWRLDLATIEAARLDRAALAWINHPHNPTGSVVDVEHLRTQVALARQHGLVLASDECYQELWFDEPAPGVLEACDGDLTGVLAIVSLSKRSGMTGYRSGAIIGDPDLIALLRRLRVNLGTASQDFVQAAAIAAWNDQDHVDERRAVFAAKRDVLLDLFDDVDVEVSGSEATFYVWFRAPGGDDVAYAHALLDERIVVTPGRSFGPSGAGWLRAALVPTLDDLRGAVARWRSAVVQGRLPA